MTLASFPGNGVVHPYVPDCLNMSPVLTTTGTVDATGEKYSVVGRVVWSDRGTHDIRSVSWRAGAIVSAGGSGITISMQDPSSATGLPARPDETQDQTVGVLLSALTANGWNSNTFSTDRTTVAHGAQIAFVWEYDGTGRLGADSFIVNGISSALARQGAGTIVTLKTGGVFGNALNEFPILLITAADGTLGTLSGAFVLTAINTHAFNSGSAADEIANQVSYAADVVLEGVELPFAVTDGADFSVIVYSGTTALETLTFDEDQAPMSISGEARWKYFPLAVPQTFTANTVYRVAIRPNTANNVTIFSFDVSAASHLGMYAGANFHYWDRVNAGAWANETTTRWVLMRLHISQADGTTSPSTAGGGGQLTPLAS